MNQPRQAQWSDDIVAVRSIEWEDGPSGAVLLVPRFRKGFLAKWLQPRLKRPYIKVKLDEIGSFVWKQMDGKKSFGEIVLSMEKEFGDKCKPAPDRLKKFLTILYKDGFVKLFVEGEQ